MPVPVLTSTEESQAELRNPEGLPFGFLAWVSVDTEGRPNGYFYGTMVGGQPYAAGALVSNKAIGEYGPTLIPKIGYYFKDGADYTVTVANADEGSLKKESKAIFFTVTPEHDWGEGMVTTEPTCTEKGVKTYTCKTEGCGATKTEEIPATGHEWGAWEVVKEATEAWIVGGPAAVPDSTLRALAARMGASKVHRLYGEDRAGTAVAIANASSVRSVTYLGGTASVGADVVAAVHAALGRSNVKLQAGSIG